MQGSVRSAILVSVCSHCLLGALLVLSFGPRLKTLALPTASFWGAYLRTEDLGGTLKRIGSVRPRRQASASHLPPASALPPGNLAGVFQKPFSPVPPSFPRVACAPQAYVLPPPVRREAVLMLYPPLPQHFRLYFKDRQRVHIEFLVRMYAEAKTPSLVVKRKISSGNIEADLLSMRYLNRYLFEQRGRFSFADWEPVKIDLELKDAR